MATPGAALHHQAPRFRAIDGNNSILPYRAIDGKTRRGNFAIDGKTWRRRPTQAQFSLALGLIPL